MPDQKINIAIIGAGKISYSLTAAFIKAGFNISIIVSKEIESAKKLAKKFCINNYSDNLKDISFNNGLFFLTVPDNQIKIVSTNLSKLKLNFQKSIFIHLSGALDTIELNSLKNKKAQMASFHIMQTFPSRKTISIKNCYAGIETNNKKTKEFLFKFAKKLSLKPFEIKSTEKTFYHLAGVFVSNFLVGNIFNSEILFSGKDKKRADFFGMMTPIIQSTLMNIKSNGVSKALSGPVERGDVQTIKRHLEKLKTLEKEKQNHILNINYIAQSLSLLEVVKKKYGKLSPSHKEIKKFLEEEFQKYKLKLK